MVLDEIFVDGRDSIFSNLIFSTSTEMGLSLMGSLKLDADLMYYIVCPNLDEAISLGGL